MSLPPGATLVSGSPPPPAMKLPPGATLVSDQTPPKNSIGDAASDFLGEFWKQVNPVAGVKGLAQAAAHPIDTYKSDADARQAVYDKAEDAFKKGNYTEGAAHLLHAFIPFVGPQLDAAANNFLQGSYAKGAGASVGMGINMAAPEAVGDLATAARAKLAPAMQSTAERLYQSALKPTAAAGDPAALVKTGLTEGIPVSEAGATKISSLIDDLNQSVKNEIAAQPGKTVNAFKVADRLNDTAKKFSNQVNPTDDLKAIRESGAEFLQSNPTDIPAADAQALKTGTYTQLKNRSFGELKSATVEAQKGLARGLKEELQTAFPEIGDMNARESKLFGLDDAIDTAVRRMNNKSIVPGGVVTTGAVGTIAGGAKGGVLGAAAGFLKAMMDDPVVKSRLAIALSSKAKIPPVIALNRVNGYAAALAKGFAASSAESVGQQEPSGELATAQ